MMKNEIKIFFTAVMFYTRIPCPQWVNHSEEYLNNATRYFPLIGWIVGAAAAGTIYLLHFTFSIILSVIFSLVVSVLLTGAFHEDGFADVCDGFGGGWTKEKILEIMKDSRIGTYGVVGLLMIILIKIFVTVELLNLNFSLGLKAVIAAHVLSRFSAVTVIFTHEYARADASSKVKPVAKHLTLKNLFISSIWTIIALLVFQNVYFLFLLIPVYIVKMFLAEYFTRWIGGYTGDCLGATQQVNEIVTLLFSLILCRFI